MLAQDTQTLAEHGRVILPGEGKDVSAPGETMYVKLAGEETDGALAIIEGIKPPRSSGAPLHIHTREDEIFYILEGALRFQLGERIFTATAGTWVYLPKGVAHAFCNPFDQPARVLGILSPAGFEHYFPEIAALMSKAQNMSSQEMAAQQADLGARHGGTMVGPPMALDPQ